MDINPGWVISKNGLLCRASVTHFRPFLNKAKTFSSTVGPLLRETHRITFWARQGPSCGYHRVAMLFATIARQSN